MKIQKAQYLAPKFNASGLDECFVYVEGRIRDPIHLEGADEIRHFLRLHGAKNVSKLVGLELSPEAEGVLA